MKVFELLKRQIQIARVYGIPVRVDYRWFIVAFVSLWLVATNFQAGTVQTLASEGNRLRLDAVTAWVFSFITTALLFLSIFGHELAHALMARFDGIETEEIVLHPFGGLARLSHAPETAGAEFRIAIAGPAASFIFALIGFAGVFAAAQFRSKSVVVFLIVGAGNLLLALFNLLPGYPLDGGRVMRAWLWHQTKNLEEATRLSSLGGQVIAWTLIVVGGYAAVIWGAWFMGAWTIIIGLFLRDAAVGVMRGLQQGADLGGRRVRDVMRPALAVAPETTISAFVDHILPVQQRTATPVARNGNLHGILTLEDLKRLPREAWHRTTVRDVMRAVDENLFVAPDASYQIAEKIMNSNGAGALGVVDARGQLVGFLQQTRKSKSV